MTDNTEHQRTDIDSVLAGTEYANSEPQGSSEPEIKAPEPSDNASETPDNDNVSRETSEEEGVSQDSSEEGASDNVDDYGNPVGEEKTYTQSEVEEMFRKRFKNNPQQNPFNNQQQQQAATQEAKDNFQYDENSDQSWEQQLEQVIDSVINKKVQTQQQKQQQQLEQQRQQEFEAKFSTGMSRFNDFTDVVGNQPFDDTMVVATRGMKDPAAFMYAASKNHPDEVKRIASIQDPYQKISEIGRLDAKMRKAKSATRAPEPTKKTPQNNAPPVGKRNIDSLIQEYGKKRFS